jgi:hypothetical protein
MDTYAPMTSIMSQVPIFYHYVLSRIIQIKNERRYFTTHCEWICDIYNQEVSLIENMQIYKNI